MSNSELKEALFTRQPVQHMGIRYDYVSAIIYRTYKRELYITAELTDAKANSVTIVHAAKVEAVSP